MNRFARTCTTRERLRATLRIENFSMYLCKGFFNSPVLETDSKRSKWSFTILAEDGDDYANFISVHLKREDRERGELSVEVAVSIIDCFGLQALTEEKNVVFNRSDDHQVFSVPKNEMLKNCSLNKKLFLPNDVLTLQCELLIHEDAVLYFQTKEEFDDSRTSGQDHSLGVSGVREYFLHSHFAKQVFDFTRCIDDFSVHACKGQYVCPEYRSQLSNEIWNLVLNVDDNDFGYDFLSIGLKRSEICKDELVQVNLSIVDASRADVDSETVDNALLSNVKLLYFTDFVEKEVLSFTKKDKERLIPNDTLCLICEVSLYKENVSAFATKEEFDGSIQFHDSSYGGNLSRLMKYVYLIFLFVALGVTSALSYGMYAVPIICYCAAHLWSWIKSIVITLYQLGHFTGYQLGIFKKPYSNFFVQYFEQKMKSGFLYWLSLIVTGICWILKYLKRQINRSENRALAYDGNAVVQYRRNEIVLHRNRNYSMRNYTNGYNSEFYPNQNWNRNYRY